MKLYTFFVQKLPCVSNLLLNIDIFPYSFKFDFIWEWTWTLNWKTLTRITVSPNCQVVTVRSWFTFITSSSCPLLGWQTNRRWRMTSKDTAYLHSFRFSRQSQGRHIAGAFSPSPWQPPWPCWKSWWNRIRHGDLDKRDQSALSSGVNCFRAKIRVGWVQYLLKQALYCPGLLFGLMVPIHASTFGGTHGSRAGAQMRQREEKRVEFAFSLVSGWVSSGETGAPTANMHNRRKGPSKSSFIKRWVRDYFSHRAKKVSCP